MKTPVLRVRPCFTFAALLMSAITIASLVGAPSAQAGTDLWIGNPGVTADTNWSDTANWSLGVGPNGNDAVFNNTGAVGAAGQVDNVVDQIGLNPSSLSYTNGTGSFHTTLIPAGITVTVTNGLNVGFAPPTTAYNTSVAITGPGELDVNGTVQVGLDKGSSTTLLDMSGLGTFKQNSASGQFLMSFTAVNNPTVNLATNSTINVATLAVEDSNGQNGRTGVLNLGSGTNILEASTIHLGLSKGTGTIQFPGGAPATAGVSITGTGGGTARASILLGQSSSGSGSSVGNLLLAGHPANVLASTMTIANRGNDTGNATGTVTLDNGTLDATTILVAEYSTNTTVKTSTGTLTIGGDPLNTATLIVNSPSGPGGGTFVLSDNTYISGTSVGTFNLNANGMALVYTSITKTNSSGGVNTATLNINGGNLNMEAAANTIGKPTLPIDNVNLNGATLNLNVVGGTSTPVINAVNLTASGVNTLNLNVANVNGSAIIPLIGYTGPDPGTNTFVVNVPTNFVATLEDNGTSLITLDLVPAGVTIYPLLWVGAVGNTVNGNWNYTTANWAILTNGTPQTYTNPDLVTFDDSASNSAVNLTANFTPGSLTFSNGITPNPLTGSPLAYTLTGPGSIGGPIELVDANSGSVTLRETGGDSFSGGITIGNNGTVVLDDANSSISGGANIGNGATLQIGNSDANGNFPTGTVVDDGTLIFNRTSSSVVSSDISGGGKIIEAGSGTVTLTVSNEISGTTLVTNGTLALTGAGSLDANNTVDVDSNATLDVTGVTGAPTFQNLTLGNCTLNQALTNQQSVTLSGTLTINGSSTITINVTSLPSIAAYPTILTNVAGNGLNNQGGTVQLGSLPAGYAGQIGISNNAILLTLTSGPTGVRPNVIWSGVDAMNNISTNWSDAQNWQLPGRPGPLDNVIFNDTDAQAGSAYGSPGGGAASLNMASINNNVDADSTVSTLIYTNLAGMYQNTYITDGVTLTVQSNMAIGSSSTDFGSSASEFVSIAGTNGRLNVSNLNSTFFVGLVFGGQGSEQATLDMSGLGTFNASVSNFAVGAVASTAVGTIGTAYLAQTNNITAPGGVPNEGGQDEPLSFMVGQTGKNGSGTCSLYLGQQNTIYVNSVGVGLAKEPGQMTFNSTFANPTATFYGAGGVGTPVSVWSIGDGLAQTGSSTVPSGTVDFSGGTVNALVTTMYIGRTPNASGSRTATGTLTFGAGTIAIGTVYNGYQAFSNTDNGAGTINVNGTGILQVGTLNMAQAIGGGTSATTGTLTINGGTVEAGTIVGSAVGQGTITLQNNGTLAISNTAGTLAAPLTTLNLDGGTLQLSPINGSTNVVATSVTTSGTTIINIATVANAGGTMQIPLIYYGGSSDPFSSLTLGTTPVGFTSPSLVDDTANQSVDLMITAPPTLTWAGAFSNGSLDSNWNFVDQNWLNGASFVAYANPDGALFNDSASNFVVNLTTTLTPISLTINSSSNYIFSYVGSIGGATSLIKQGTGTLTLDHRGLNTYSGGTIISGGTLQIGFSNDGDGSLPPGGNVTDNSALVFDQSGSNSVTAIISGPGTVAQIGSGKQLLSGVNSYSGATLISSGTLIVGNAGGPSGTNSSLGVIPGGAVTITNGGTMDLGGNSAANQLGFTNLAAATAKQFFVSGTGVGGNGAIVNNGSVSQDDALQYVSLTANATVGGPTRWDMRGAGSVFPVLNLTNNTLTKTGTNQISIVGATVTSGNIVINQGILSFDTYVVFPTGSSGTITVNSGGSMGQFRGALNSATNAGNAAGLTRPITLNGGAITNLSTGGAIGTNDASITLTANSILGGSTTNNYAIVFDGVIGDGGGGFGLTKAGVGPVVLTAINTYGGATLINSGSLALAGSGSIPASSTITIALGATLDASGRTDQTLTLNSGQTLNGFGTVTGLVVAASGSTIAPGSSSSVGELTVSGNSTLNGNTLMKLNTSTNDVLAAGGTVNYGGTLTLTNISGTPLAAGNSFKLFNAGAYSGSFSSIVTQPPLSAGLSWNNSAGVFTIVSTSGPSTNASITHVSLSSGNLLVHGTNNNVPNTNFHYAVLIATNIATPLSNWTIISTNSFNPDGTFDYTNPVVPGTPRQFLDVKAVP